jgi:putative heme-binding domain-containing protein
MTNVHRTVLGAVSAAALLLGGLLRAERIAAPVEPLAQTSEPSRGRTLAESTGCFDCHRIGDRGSRVGPNLTDVGGRRTPDQLRQALVAPDDEVLPENRSVRLVTREGAAITGRLLNQDGISVQLITSGEELKTYPKDGLREFSIVDKGLMPSAQGKLTDQQIADLVGYLASLKAN